MRTLTAGNTSVIATVATTPMFQGPSAPMEKKGCRRVKGGACLCNGRFAKKSRCR